MAASTWYPGITYQFELLGNPPNKNILMAGPTLGQVQDSGVGGITSGTFNTGVQGWFPPVGNPHVANQVYFDPATGLMMVSTG